MEVSLTLTDQKAIEIITGLPENERDHVIERYILLGDTVMQYATITTSDDSIQRFFTPSVDKLTGLADTLREAKEQLTKELPGTIDQHTRALAHNLQTTLTTLGKTVEGLETDIKRVHDRIEGASNDGMKRIEDRIPETIKSEISAVTAELKKVVTDFDQLKTDLGQVIPTLKISSKRGKVAEAGVFQGLCDSFKDCIFNDLSQTKHSTDIVGTVNGLQHPIYIEVKDYTNDVPSDQVEKFWRDMDERSARIGCFVSMHTRIGTVTSDLAIMRRGNVVGIFVVNAVFEQMGHIYAFLIARRLAELTESSGEPSDNASYDIIVRILNNQFRTIKKQVDELRELENIISKAQDDVNKSLGKLASRTTSIRTTIEDTIDSVLRDFGNLSASSIDQNGSH